MVGGLGVMGLQLFQGLLEFGESSADKDTQVYTIRANTKYNAWHTEPSSGLDTVL